MTNIVRTEGWNILINLTNLISFQGLEWGGAYFFDIYISIFSISFPSLNLMWWYRETINITFISKLKLVLSYNLIIVPLVVRMKNAGLLASTSCTENKTFFMWIWLYYKNLVAAKWIIQRIHSSMYTQLSYSVPYVKANETLHYYTIKENIWLISYFLDFI